MLHVGPHLLGPRCLRAPSWITCTNEYQACTHPHRPGPWKGAWVRRAYDPRAHPEARRLQTLAYELPEAWWQRLVEVKAVQKAQAAEEAPAGPAGAGNAGQEPRPLPLITPPPPATWAQLHSFQALPSQRTTLFQVGEIDDGEVQALLNDASNFSEVRGRGAEDVHAEAGDLEMGGALLPGAGGLVRLCR